MKTIYFLLSFLAVVQGIAMESPQAMISVALNSDELLELVALINDAYLEGEKDICKPTMKRASPEALRQMIEKGELIELRIGKSLKGCIRVCASPYAPQAAIFGMLAVANTPECRGKGFGSLLVDEAERWAKSRGYHFMNLELLKPTDFPHAHKDRLQSWYEKRGYAYEHSEQFKFEEVLMIENYEFKIFRKQL